MATGTSSSGSLTALNSVGITAESEAFRKCSADLIRGIQDPELLAWELYSDDVVSETVVDEVSVVGLSGVQKKSRLLSAVRDQIAVDPAKFQNFLQALNKQPPLIKVAKKLEANCDRQKQSRTETRFPSSSEPTAYHQAASFL